MSSWPVDATLVDPEALARWMDVRGLGSGPLVDAERLAGGTQNVLLRFSRAERTYVLRRPPPHKRGNSDETMRREARVLSALSGTDVPHPGLIAAEPDLDVLGCAFYLMEPIDGLNPTVTYPDVLRGTSAQFDVGCSMADAIAALARIDHEAAGLADLGKPDGWLERQVERWRSHLAGYASFEGYTGPDIPGVEEVAAWLEAHRPTAWTPGVIHGDFHFANVLVHPTEPRLAAVVDWELATIGDPLLDLGHLMATWPATGRFAAVGGAMPSDGLPSLDQLVDRYADGSTRDLSNATWYRVLACYRLGIILEGTHARASAGMAPVEIGDMLHATTVALFEQALGLI